MSFLAHALFGGTCCLCRGGSRTATLCTGCEADLPRALGARCPRCALPVPDPGAHPAQTCGRCLTEKPAYDHTLALWDYAFPADVLVQLLKFRGELALARYFGERMAALVGSAGDIDLCVPVPLHPARLAERGCNQSLEIARILCRRLRVRLSASACERARRTGAQAALPLGARQANVRGAFRCITSLSGLRVAVVDDVMTTGATLDAMARALKDAGAVHVVNWVLARTPEPGSQAPR